MKNMPNHPDVRSLDVLQYVLGRVSDPDRRAVIEGTRNTHPELWEGLTDEPTGESLMHEQLGPDATEDSIPVEVDKYFAQRAEVRRVIDEIAEGLNKSKDGRKLDFRRPVLERWNAKRFGGTTVRALAESTSSYDHGTRAEYPELPNPPYVVAFQQRIYIAQPADKVPYGVVRVIASVEGRPLTSIVRVMELDENAGLWTLDVSATEFFDRDVPNGDLDFHVQPARRELFAWFSAKEIEDLAMEIAEDRVKERQAVQTLLHDLKEWGNAS